MNHYFSFLRHCTLSLAILAFISLGIRLGAEEASAADSPVAVAMGAKVFAEACIRCHEPPEPASRDARTWRNISLHMRLFGDLSREDQQRVYAFLRQVSANANTKKN